MSLHCGWESDHGGGSEDDGGNDGGDGDGGSWEFTPNMLTLTEPQSFNFFTRLEKSPAEKFKCSQINFASMVPNRSKDK